MAADHERVLRQLDTVNQELRQLYAAVAESKTVQVPKEWYQERIETNAEPYGRIHDLLASLTEEEFPTVRTWYGDAWRELVTPFQNGSFPTKFQRDRLVQLLNEIREGEQRRLAALEQTSTGPTAAAAPASAALCLGPRGSNWQATCKDSGTPSDPSRDYSS